MDPGFSPKWLQPLGIDFFCVTRKYLVFNMVGRNLKVKYRRSFLGVLWTLLAPLGTAAIFYYVFEVIFKQGTPHFATFMLLGILPWTFFSGTLIEGTDSLTGNQGLLTKVPIPPQIFPLVGTLTNAVTLLLSMLVIVGALLLSGLPVLLNLFALIVASLFLFFTSYGLSVFFGVMAVFFRDLKHMVALIIQIAFYATPVLYSPSMIPERYHWILYLNPAAAPFVLIRETFEQQALPSAEWLWVSLWWSIVAILIGFLSIWWSRHFLVENL